MGKAAVRLLRIQPAYVRVIAFHRVHLADDDRQRAEGARVADAATGGDSFRLSVSVRSPSATQALSERQGKFVER